MRWLIALGLLAGTAGCRLGFDPMPAASEAGVSEAGTVDATIVTCNTGWSRRHQLTIDTTGQVEDLTNFPVLVELDATTIDYAVAQPDGRDLRFADLDGTALAHELEHWTEGGTSFVWVNVPRIAGSSSESLLWMYYGNPTVADGQDRAGTWNAGYQAVWHMSETSGPLVDSARGIACAWGGGGSGMLGVAGRIARATGFDGTVDRADCGLDRIEDNVDSTITAWLKMPLTGDVNQQVVAVESLSNPYPGIALYVRRTDGALGKWLDGTYRYATRAENRVAVDTWGYAAVRTRMADSGGVVEVSQNGGAWEAVVTGDTRSVAIPAATPLVLGRWTGAGPSVRGRGVFDEIRISNVRRSDAWVHAEYRSMSGALLAIGAAEACP